MVKSFPPRKPPPQKPQKKQKQKPTGPVVKDQVEDGSIPVEIQQNLLNIFKDTCAQGSTLDLESTSQEVKGHLYNRDFATAFGKAEYLEAYAARWSPSRALGYAQIFSDIVSHVTETVKDSSPTADKVQHQQTDGVDNITKEMKETLKLDDESSTIVTRNLRVVALGGGAGAELVGLAGWLRHLQEIAEPSDSGSSQPSPYKLHLLGLDIANWDKVMSNLHHRITHPAILSKYASATAQAANTALLDTSDINVRFQQQDILTATISQIRDSLQDTDIITIMFTLNELYTTSVSKTQALLYNLTSVVRPGTLLLVVDSPGSYSSVTINGAEKKYPMQWLLDHTLIGATAEESQSVKWEKLIEDESRWFRLPKGLKYPIELENMRYQIHLYRRCSDV